MKKNLTLIFLVTITNISYTTSGNITTYNNNSNVNVSNHSSFFSWISSFWSSSNETIKRSVDIKGSENIISTEFAVENPINTITAQNTTTIIVHHVNTLAEQKVILTTHDNVIEYFSPVVTGSILSLGRHDFTGSLTTEGVTYELYLNTKNISRVQTQNNVYMIFTNTIENDLLNAKFSNRSKIEMTLNVKNLQISTGNKSTAEISGQANIVSIDAANNSKILLKNNFKAQNLSVNATNNANVTGTVESDIITINSTNNSHVALSGKAISVSKNAAGRSNIDVSELIINK